jgi:hypothetical protein
MKPALFKTSLPNRETCADVELHLLESASPEGGRTPSKVALRWRIPATHGLLTEAAVFEDGVSNVEAQLVEVEHDIEGGNPLEGVPTERVLGGVRAAEVIVASGQLPSDHCGTGRPGVRISLSPPTPRTHIARTGRPSPARRAAQNTGTRIGSYVLPLVSASLVKSWTERCPWTGQAAISSCRVRGANMIPKRDV